MRNKSSLNRLRGFSGITFAGLISVMDFETFFIDPIALYGRLKKLIMRLELPAWGGLVFWRCSSKLAFINV